MGWAYSCIIFISVSRCWWWWRYLTRQLLLLLLLYFLTHLYDVTMRSPLYYCFYSVLLNWLMLVIMCVCVCKYIFVYKNMIHKKQLFFSSFIHNVICVIAPLLSSFLRGYTKNSRYTFQHFISFIHVWTFNIVCTHTKDSYATWEDTI